jgi:hypothetical protein
MSESVFKYDPPDGAISGPSFIDQTESAIRETGAHLVSVEGKADTAQGIANGASSTANEALMAANKAQTDATQALADASQGISDAGAASQSAADAMARANDAYDIGLQGKDKAEAAQETADGARAQADSGVGKAETAQETANAANSQADSAYSLAENALGKWFALTEDFDADEFYLSVAKYYITGTAGFAGLPVLRPCFFQSGYDSANDAAVQTCFAQTGPPIWIRTGSVTEDQEEGYLVTWGAWATISPDLATIQAYVDEQINQKIGNTLNYRGDFVGFYDDAPSGDGEEGNVLLKLDGTKTAAFTDGEWVEADYSHGLFDLWANKTDGHGYYWFNDEWNILDFNADLSGLLPRSAVVTAFSDTPNDDNVPSEKLVASALNALTSSEPRLTRSSHTADSDLAAGAVLTVPSHTVGSGGLLVFWDGLLAREGDGNQYVDSTGTSITLVSGAPAGTQFEFLAWG